MQRALQWLRTQGVPLLAVGVLLCLAAYNSSRKSIWLDEAFSLDTARRTLAGTWEQTLRFEQQPPLYFLLLHLWLKISPSLEFARLLSTIFAALSIWMLHRTAQLLAIPRSSASLLPLIAALCPGILWAASEVRVYALTLLLTTCATYLFVRVWVVGTTRPVRDCALYVLFCNLSLLTFYYSGFLLAGQFVAGLLGKERRRALILSWAALSLLMLPWVPMILSQASGHPNLNDANLVGESWLASMQAVFEWAGQILRSIFFRGAPLLKREGVIPALVSLIGAIIVARFWRRSARPCRPEVALGVVTLVPLATFVLLRVSNWYHVEDRYFTIIVGAVLTLGAVTLGRIPSPRTRALLGAGLAAFFAVSTLSYQRNYPIQQDWPSAAGFVAAHERAGEPIFFCDGYGILPFRYYYRGPNALHGVPRDPLWHTYAMDTLIIRDERQARERIAAVVGPGRGFWLIGHWAYEWSGGDILDRFIASLDVMQVREFKGVRVSHIRLPAAP